MHDENKVDYNAIDQDFSNYLIKFNAALQWTTADVVIAYLRRNKKWIGLLFQVR
jgi:hypothetical protein